MVFSVMATLAQVEPEVGRGRADDVNEGSAHEKLCVPHDPVASGPAGRAQSVIFRKVASGKKQDMNGERDEVFCVR
jgi:hypothetical protein